MKIDCLNGLIFSAVREGYCDCRDEIGFNVSYIASKINLKSFVLATLKSISFL